MTSQLNYLIAQERQIELARRAEGLRVAADARAAGSASAPAAERVTIADGREISLRPLVAEDRHAFAALFARLTPESRYRRFLYPKRELTSRELTFYTDVDHVDHDAVAAIDEHDDSIVGVARYVRDADRPRAAEVAIEVADAYQMLGLGGALANVTIARADANGLTLLTATTLWANVAARRLLRRAGFSARKSRGAEIAYELELDKPVIHQPQTTQEVSP